MTRILVIDNYDSFTFNLVHAAAAAGATVEVARNDAIDRNGVAAAEPDGIILSPGPGHPGERRDFGVCTDLIQDPLEVPLLGVCLGMQGLALHTGGEVMRAPRIVHGMASPVLLQPHPLFTGLPEAVQVGRYHSLAVAAQSLPSEWEPLGSTDDGILMAMAHRARPWVGVQFHPESILTPEGPKMMANFVRICEA